jgi:hypothetical protein
MTYERQTAAPAREALTLAEQILMERLPLTKVSGDAHSLTLSGGDGTVTFHAHRHGMDTVVSAATDQLRTSRLDIDVQYVMQMLPYQPGDRKAPSQTKAGGLTVGPS